jgi:hypothetical protein
MANSELSAADQIFDAIKTGISVLERDARKDIARSVYVRKGQVEEIIGNKRPYGLRLKDNRDVPDGSRAEAVRRAFMLRLGGEVYRGIVLALQAIAPPQKFKRGMARVNWTTVRVARMLSNRAYVAGGIIDEMTFARVQRINAEGSMERRATAWPWPLTGAISCHCGRHMNGHAWGKTGHRIRYYSCNVKSSHDGQTRIVRSDALEAKFVELLGQLSASSQIIAHYRQQTKARKIRDAEAILSRAANTFARSTVEEQRRIARSVAIELGGLVVEEDGRLTVRRV